MDCNCLAIAGNAALSGFAFGSIKTPSPLDMGQGKNLPYPPRLKITLMVVSTSTGSLLSR